jgi:hypothetical protein
VFSTDVPGTIIELSSDELKNVGISGVGYQTDAICYGLHDLEISVPDRFQEIEFVGASLILHSEGKEIAYIDLLPIRTEETLYQDTPFHGVSFCLGKEHWNSAEIVLDYRKGYVQKTIKIKEFEKWVKDKNS